MSADSLLDPKQTPRKYKLLRDLPIHNAGTIFKWNVEQDYYLLEDNPQYTTPSGKKVLMGYPKDVVENKPDWFSPIQEPLPTNRECLFDADRINKRIEELTFEEKGMNRLIDAIVQKLLMDDKFIISLQTICQIRKEITTTSLSPIPENTTKPATNTTYTEDTKEPLFTTEDGKPIYMNDEYWAIFVDKPEKYTANKYCSTDPRNPKRFSTKEAAEEYLKEILGGKRRFTRDEVMEAENKAFEAARLTHPMIGMKYETFNDYKNQK